jgi:hypothetical protein
MYLENGTSSINIDSRNTFKICALYFHVLKNVFKFYCNLYVQF